MESNMVNLGISNELIKPIIEKHIKAAITEAMGGSEKLIDMAIDKILNSKVTSDGKVSQYSSENRIPLLEWVLTDQIRSAVQTVVIEEIKKASTSIRDSIIKKLRSDKGSNMMADALLSCFMNTLESKWYSDIKIEMKKCSEK